MRIYKCGNWRKKIIQFKFIETSDHRKQIEFEFMLWSKSPVWRLIPSITISGALNNFLVLFQFLKFTFYIQWFNWKNPHSK